MMIAVLPEAAVVPLYRCNQSSQCGTITNGVDVTEKLTR